MGNLTLESAVTSGTTLSVASGGAAQNIKVGVIGEVSKNLPDFLCINRYPDRKDSYYSVSYSGGAADAAETAINFA